MIYKTALFLILILFSLEGTTPQKISVIGTGYVGLVLGACLSELGHHVICADVDQNKINNLINGKIPIYEPGLNSIVQSNYSNKRLEFTSNIVNAIQATDIIFIAVGTPTLEDGSADISALEKVADVIAKNLNGHKVICIRSTIPVGTTRQINARIASHSHKFELCFCPEFLREGSAVFDFFNNDRFVIGAESQVARGAIEEVFSYLASKNTPFVNCNFETAEAIKYASNAFLASKISFINEFANFCQAKGADIVAVSEGMGLDKRIGPDFLKPGPGYGGSCFPKDTLALVQQANEVGVELDVVKAVIKANENQKIKMVDKLEQLLNGSLLNKKVAILGLAFKANTDDVRMSPSITIIKEVEARGGLPIAYDPMAVSNMKLVLPDLICTASIEAAVKDADAVVIVTEWEEFKKMDLNRIQALMKTPVLLDTRNLFAPQDLVSAGFRYDNLGRQ